MALFTLWRGDQYSTPQIDHELAIQKESNISMLASLMKVDEQRIQKRFQEGHECWVARLAGIPVSFGWVGHTMARIGELEKDIFIPEGNAYLWNFRTLESYRGRGYYVQLLSTILKAEESVSERIWIISAPENKSSYNGIIKTGFKPVGEIIFDYQDEVTLLVNDINERAQAGAHLIQIPITTVAAHECWKCSSKTMTKDTSCDCHEKDLPCSCGQTNVMSLKSTIL